MVTITLPPELEQVVAERAHAQGTTAELYLLNTLRQHFQSTQSYERQNESGETAADFFKGYAGTIDSREIIPEGVHLSKDTGTRFREIMLQKHRSGKV